ncbi:hypothetical protein F5Y19DRAFT_346491 [Xylariaceae sp. FL1651]|nr:hypothetical protein F5Y19DRAFT_346491 [Xylariaceae sp. FL1651]
MASLNGTSTELSNQNGNSSLTTPNDKGLLEDALLDTRGETQHRPANTLPSFLQGSLAGENLFATEQVLPLRYHSGPRLSTVLSRNNEFTHQQLVEDGILSLASTVTYTQQATPPIGDLPSTQRENSRLSVASVHRNESATEQLLPNVLVHRPDGEADLLDEDGHPQRPVSAPESVNSDFTHVTTVVDFGLAVGIDHVNDQIRNGQLSPQFSTRIKDDNSSQGQMTESEQDFASTLMTGIGDHFGAHLDSQNSSTELVEDLSEQLEAEQTKSQHNVTKRFLPLDKLVTMLQESNIERELRQVFPIDRAKEMIKDICRNDPKDGRRLIMAILSSIGQVASIEHFIKEEICDGDLPLTRYIDEERRTIPLFHRSRDKVEQQKPFDFLRKHWKAQVLEHFCTVQYSFVVPFFDMPRNHVNFYKMEDSRIILPFLKWEKQISGGYGTVWKAYIHPAHHNYPSESESTCFAVKEIHSNDYEAYKEEVRVLERYSGTQKGHDHLIRLLMAFQHNSQYYLVFPLAVGNLKDIWQKTRKRPTLKRDVLWVLQQCLGVADGLWKIHKHESWFAKGLAPSRDEDKNRGRHGDIKPQNILVFKTSEEGQYRLVISDFGLTRFHSAQSISNVPPDKVGGLSRTYRAPEFDLNATISQAYDMWSLGCLYLELISWFLLGFEDGPKEFAYLRGEDDIPTPGLPPIPNYTEDKFFNIINNEPVVKDSVRNWFDKLRRLPSCPPCISDFLDFIQLDLLNPTKLARSKIDQLHLRLNDILKRSIEKSNYCIFSNASLPSDEPVESEPLARRPNSPRSESAENRSESLKLQQIILEQRDKNRTEVKRASLDLATIIASQLPIESVAPKSGTTVPPPSRSRKRLSLESSEGTIKANNYTISSQAINDGRREHSIPRTIGNPSLARNMSGTTDTTFNISQENAHLNPMTYPRLWSLPAGLEDLHQ